MEDEVQSALAYLGYVEVDSEAELVRMQVGPGADYRALAQALASALNCTVDLIEATKDTFHP